jgi:hypothetical protein
MNLEEKIIYMQSWCSKHGLELTLSGECGFGRPCVGVIHPVIQVYPSYVKYDENWEYVFGEDVWTPKDAYHKHSCVAVLGQTDESIEQLYTWIKWFDDNGYNKIRIEPISTSSMFQSHEVYICKE